MPYGIHFFQPTPMRKQTKNLHMIYGLVEEEGYVLPQDEMQKRENAARFPTV
jgi:hypothetical protein